MDAMEEQERKKFRENFKNLPPKIKEMLTNALFHQDVELGVNQNGKVRVTLPVYPNPTLYLILQSDRGDGDEVPQFQCWATHDIKNGLSNITFSYNKFILKNLNI